MDNKELIEKVLGRSADYFTDNHVENQFPREYELVEKIYKFLSADEFSTLYDMMNENDMNLFRILNYFQYEKEN